MVVCTFAARVSGCTWVTKLSPGFGLSVEPVRLLICSCLSSFQQPLLPEGSQPHQEQENEEDETDTTQTGFIRPQLLDPHVVISNRPGNGSASVEPVPSRLYANIEDCFKSGDAVCHATDRDHEMTPIPTRAGTGASDLKLWRMRRSGITNKQFWEFRSKRNKAYWVRSINPKKLTLVPYSKAVTSAIIDYLGYWTFKIRATGKGGKDRVARKVHYAMCMQHFPFPSFAAVSYSSCAYCFWQKYSGKQALKTGICLIMNASSGLS